uniref:Uncharacterized protein n=1 Tax=Nelumbo nucifera TaxID=4432 RepID=A0A822ZBT0_NELNU|nr:TPA_asm: hypothetical protein HUJ06_015252 [Nelumbo nucifera]
MALKPCVFILGAVLKTCKSHKKMEEFAIREAATTTR